MVKTDGPPLTGSSSRPGLARGEPGLGRRQSLRRADMQPVAVVDQAEQAPGRLCTVIEDVQRERPIWSIGEQPLTHLGGSG
jgi:hypothetical protein